MGGLSVGAGGGTEGGVNTPIVHMFHHFSNHDNGYRIMHISACLHKLYTCISMFAFVSKPADLTRSVTRRHILCVLMSFMFS